VRIGTNVRCVESNQERSNSKGCSANSKEVRRSNSNKVRYANSNAFRWAPGRSWLSSSVALGDVVQDSGVDTPHSGKSARAVLRDPRALVVGGLRVRGWTWLLSMLWALIGAGGAIYSIVVFHHPGYGEGLLIPPTIQWPSEPQLITDVSVIAEAAWFLLAGPVLISGFVRLRGWRPRNWLRAAGWAGCWVAGLALVIQTRDFATAGLGGAPSDPSVGEMVIGALWLALGGAMTWILAVPSARRNR
jgi:hypothetical protein